MRKKLARMLVVLTCFLIVNVIQGIPGTVVKVSGQPEVPYDLGNWTYIAKPVYPVGINVSQIGKGADWTYVCKLKAGSLYHVYFYGDWIDYEPLTNKTDYDIYVYNPLGELESLHTESAGLPEHLGTTVEEPFFTPKLSGDYSFRIVNDPKESRDAKGGTFMLIEHLECDRWHELYLVGKMDDKPVEDTSWAYEFMTSSRQVEVRVEVPDTLDMYEVQLYLMANPSQEMGTLLNGVPIAWEPGLYRETDPSGIYGGYSLENEGLRHFNASDSCEFLGQDMLINYTFPFPEADEQGNSTSTGLEEDEQGGYTSPAAADMFLYHLVLVAENGKGEIRYMFKTDFKAPSLSILNPVERAYPENATEVTAKVYDQESGLEAVSLSYTRDDWETWYTVKMSPSANRTFVGRIPRQLPGSTVKYKITASDKAGNTAEEESGYIVKTATDITISLSKSALCGDESVKVRGTITKGDVAVTLNYTCGDLHVLRQVPASYIGSFIDEYTPEKIGVWTVSASWLGDEKHFEAFSDHENFTVEKALPSITLSLSKPVVYIDENMSVLGTISKSVAEVRLNYTCGDLHISKVVFADENGAFSDEYVPKTVGAWTVCASWPGDEKHFEAFSDRQNFTVERIPTDLAFYLSPSTLNGGESVEVTGTVSNGAAQVTLNYRCGDLRVTRVAATSESGSFSDTYTPERTGAWTVSASWPGDEKHSEASSSDKNFTVTKVSTWITCKADAEAMIIGEQMRVTGSVVPQSASMRVSLVFTKPDQTILTQYTFTSSDGTFNLIFRPDLLGPWSVQASLVGDNFRQPSYSVPISFSVNETWINQYRWHIIGGTGIGIAAVSGVFLYHRRQGEWEEELEEEPGESGDEFETE